MVEYSAENAQYGAASAGCGAYSGSNSLVFRFQRRWTQSVHEFFGSGAPSGNASVMPPYSS